MLFKWLFVVFAFWWLYHALRPWLAPQRPAGPPDMPPSEAKNPENNRDRSGEYIDYEEIEED
ncbi:MAG: hypothetical protein ABIO24_08940 [Saprospiraceae bacterium]